MTADPRDTARQWLAEVIGRHLERADGTVITRTDIADAILSAPGVEVGIERYRDLGDPAEVHTGVVIRLPVEVAGE